MSLRVVFAGTPCFVVPTLEALLNSSHEVVGVYTQPDRPSGRGQKVTESPVKIAATQHHLPVYQPPNFREEASQLPLKVLKPDVIVVLAYGLILPKAVLEIPRLGCINVHPSLLPRWRGAAPVIRTIEAGDHETGVTVMKMNERMDAGDIISQVKCEVLPADTGDCLLERLFNLGISALLEALNQLEKGKIALTVQDESKATYAHKVSKAEAKIDWQLSAEELAYKVRAFHSVPVAHAVFEGNILRVWEAEVISSSTSVQPGFLVKASREGIDVACRKGVLRLKKLQMPGKNVISAADFLNAYQNKLNPLSTQF